MAQDVVQLAIPNLKNNNLDIKKTEKSFSLESYRLRNKWQMLKIYDLTTARRLTDSYTGALVKLNAVMGYKNSKPVVRKKIHIHMPLFC